MEAAFRAWLAAAAPRTGAGSGLERRRAWAMVRAFYKGDYGFQRWVGWSVITHNLVSIARAERKRQQKKHGTP